MNYYNPYYAQMPMQMPQQMSQQSMPQAAPQAYAAPQQNSLLWVNGEQEATNYLVAPNSAVALWDSTAPVVYMKQADASGRPTFRAFDLVERNAQSKQAGVEYATKADLEELAKAVKRLESDGYTPKYAREAE